MSDNNGDKDKLNLNLGAKSFVPKNIQNNQNNQNNLNNNFMNQNNQMNMNMYGMNQMGYNPYNYMNNMNMNNMNMNNMNMMGNNFNQMGQLENQFNNVNLNNNTQKTETKKQIVTNQNVNQNNQNNQNKKIDTNKNNTNKDNTKKDDKKVVNKVNDNKEVKKNTNTNNNNNINQKKVEEKVTEKKNDKIENSEPIKYEEEDMELLEDTKEGKMIEVNDNLQPVSIVFMGHVDHGKSTIAGNILVLTGMVDERTLEKNRLEAIQNKKESWYLSYSLDINKEEREKGKTVEIGKAFFKTENKRYTILDAPGHSGFLPNLLLGACHADYVGLVISAKAGEFEAGFEKSGSTKEHSLLAKSLGVTKIIVIINKMDEESVKWSQKRFDEIKANLGDYLKKIGFAEKDIQYIPISGLKGNNIKEPLSKDVCDWYNGNTLLETFDKMEIPVRDRNGPLRISILDRYKEGGLFIMGKVESGTIKYGGNYTIMPLKQNIEVSWLFNSEELGVPYALPGELVRVRHFYLLD